MWITSCALRIFVILGILLLLAGLALSFRYLYFFFISQGAGHFQSFILAGVLRIVDFQVLLIGLMADLVGINRRNPEEIFFRLRKVEFPNEEADSEQRTFSHLCPFLFTLVVV